MRPITAGLLVFLGLAVLLAGEAPGKDMLHFKRLGVEEGLSAIAVTFVHQDRQGFIWIGTFDGLNRYDGKTLKVFKPDPGKKESLSDKGAIAMVEDEFGFLWIGGADGVLNRYDPSTGNFAHFPPPKGTEAQYFLQRSIGTICVDRRGTYWLGTSGNGIFTFDPAKKEYGTSFKNIPGNPDSLSSNNVSHIFEDSRGNLWISTRDKGLDKYEPGSRRFTHYRHEPGNPQSIASDRVLFAREDQQGIFWIGTGDGLNRLDTWSNSFKVYRYDPESPHSIGNNLVTCMHRSSGGELWFGTGIGGLNRFDPVTERFTAYLHRPHDYRTIGSNNITGIYEDRTGQLWIGSGNSGASILDQRTASFTLYQHEPHNPNSLSANRINAIRQDRAGNIWAATQPDGLLNKFDRQKGTWSRYDLIPRDGKSRYVIHLLGDSNNELWLGTGLHGIIRFDPAGGASRNYRFEKGNPDGLNHDTIWTLYEDRDREFWVGTGGGGLSRMDRETGKFTHYTHKPGDATSISHNNVTRIYQDRGGIFWIGTEGGGLNRFDKRTGVFKCYKHRPGDPRSLGNDYILGIVEDKAGRLWLGTWGGGLNRMDPVTGQFFHYTEEDGLSNNSIAALHIDEKGRLWMSSYKGISCFFPDTGTFSNYYRLRDGLQGYVFSPTVAHRGPGGEMFFGGPNGLNAFFPDKVQANQAVPAVVFTDFKLFNKPVPVGPGSILTRLISDTRSINLEHDQNVFSFEFAALDFTEPSKNQYKYRLKGFSNEWLYLGNKSDITFTGLKPGDYVLQVIGANNNSVWNETGVSIRIGISPPVWQTWWFRTSMVLVLIVLLLFVHRWRMKQVSIKMKTESQMDRIFARFNISPREQDLINLMVMGKSNKEIEEELYISHRTVKSHIYNIYKKLGVKNRLELINKIHKSAG